MLTNFTEFNRCPPEPGTIDFATFGTTAIVHAVQGKGRYTIAHQNFGRAGRKVSLAELELDHIVKGKYTIYRPGR